MQTALFRKNLVLVIVLLLSIAGILPVIAINDIQINREWSNPSYDVDWWPMFRHDQQHTGYSTSYAPSTNNTIWSYTTGDKVYSSPAVVDERLYVGSYDGKFYCLNALTGDKIWEYTTGGAIVMSSPAVVDNKVYVGSRDFKFYCLDATNGDHIWNYSTNGWVDPSPVVVDNKVYFGSRDKKIYCLNAFTGEKIWDYTTSGEMTSSPAVVCDRVYVGAAWPDGRIYCLDASTGDKIWSYQTGQWIFSSPAVVEGRVYVGSNDYKVYCLNATDGSLIWSYTTGGKLDWCSPAVVNERVYIGSRDGRIYCLDAIDGSMIWNYTTDGWISSSPAVADDGKVYMGSCDGKVYCLDAVGNGDGTTDLIWLFTTGSEVWSSPAIANGRVYIGSLDRKVYCFGEQPLEVYVDDDFNSSTPGWGYDHFDKIQDGIDAVADNGTVYVYNGIYYENVVVNKSINLIGEDRDRTIIDAQGNGSSPYNAVIWIDYSWYSPSWINISGFTVANASRGIASANSTAQVRIRDCIVRECTGFAGVFIHYNPYSTIESCFSYNNSGWGIVSELGRHSSIKNCTVFNNGKGILLIGPAFFNIINCTIFNNEGIGIKLTNSMPDEAIKNVMITGCTILNNTYGIQLQDSEGCSSNNLIYHNNFINSVQNAYDEEDDIWDNGYPSGGNYWSDFDEPSEGAYDNNSDGIVDSPYLIPGGSNQDRYPLTTPYGPPHADFNYSVHDRMVFFNASLSYDYDGEIVSYDWNFGDGKTGMGMIVEHTYSDYGTYNVTLMVTDDGLTDSISKNILVIDKIPPDVSYPNIEPTVQVLGGYVNISAKVTDSGGVDDVHLILIYPDGQVRNFSVKQNRTDDTYYCNQTYSQRGRYSCYFWAIDTSGNTATSVLGRFFDIEEEFTVDAYIPSTGLVNETIEFHASASGGKPPYHWHWDFGDGENSTQQNTTHIYTQPGVYGVVLSVTDSEHHGIAIRQDIIIIEDTTPPSLEIITPTKAIYFHNNKILPFFVTIIIGSIDVEVNASDSGSGIDRVEFYLDNSLKANITVEPYTWSWSEKTFGRHTIKAVAYDNAGNHVSKQITVWRFF